MKLKIVPPKWGFRCAAGKAIPKAIAIVLDFAGILVHIFHPEEREYYNVERLWMDATTEIIRPEK